MPLSQIVSASIEDGAVAPVDLSSLSQYTGFKNRFINGQMAISQRGTSFSTPATGTYTLDRWLLNWGGAAPASVAQVAGIGVFQYALQITGGASNTQTYISQRIESANCYDLAGTTVSLSAVMQASTSQTVLWQAYYANVKDNFSGNTFISSGSFIVTTSAQSFSTQISLPSGVQNGVLIAFFPQNAGAFTSGTFTITGVQLEKGVTATSFDYRPYGTELQLCQRYYQIIGQVITTTSFYSTVSYMQPMRTFPSIGPVTFDAGTGATFLNMNVSTGASITKAYQNTNHSQIAQANIPLSAEL